MTSWCSFRNPLNKMAATRLRLTSLKLLQKYNVSSAYRAQKALFCTGKPGNEESGSEEKSRFAQFEKKQAEILEKADAPPEESGSEKKSRFVQFEKKQAEILEKADAPQEGFATEKKSRFVQFEKKQAEILEKVDAPPEEPVETFVSLLRNSKFIAMGDPVGKTVIGKIYHVVDRDLYIDFGWKFPTVCTAPEKNRDSYTVGTKVKLLIKDLELSTKFLGGEEDITLCEADCVLLGIWKPYATAT